MPTNLSESTIFAVCFHCVYVCVRMCLHCVCAHVRALCSPADGREPPGFVPVELWGCTTSGGLVLSQNSKFQIMVMVVVINM